MLQFLMFEIGAKIHQLSEDLFKLSDIDICKKSHDSLALPNIVLELLDKLSCVHLNILAAAPNSNQINSFIVKTKR